MLSAIIIVKNESHNIKKCLESLHFVDQIVVLDSGSIDDTIEICKQYQCEVHQTDWPGFGPQKQRALELAKHPWVLSIDADEVVTDLLRNEIINSIKEASSDGYFMPRLSHVMGKPIKRSGWYPDYILRLFKKEKARFSDDLVHEKVILNSKNIAKLKNPLMHYSYSNLDQLVLKMNQYSSLGAQKLKERGKKSNLLTAILRAKLAFIKLYILKLGFLDGYFGFIIAISSAESAYYKYIKLWVLNQQDKK